LGVWLEYVNGGRGQDRGGRGNEKDENNLKSQISDLIRKPIGIRYG